MYEYLVTQPPSRGKKIAPLNIFVRRPTPISAQKTMALVFVYSHAKVGEPSW